MNYEENHPYLYLAVLLVVLAIESFIVMLLWNSIMVSLFNVPIIGYWTAVGIKILCGYLFRASIKK